MGRKTWESLGRPLPNRRNMVISRQSNLLLNGAEVFASIDAAIEACKTSPEIFIIGGAQVYEQAMPLVDQLIITEVAIDITGDAYFPKVDNSWQIVERHDFPTQINPKNPEETFPAYAFVTYRRSTR
jgi:dihydrofolate reductase